MLGGIIRGIIKKRHEKKKDFKDRIENGILLALGYIAGEALLGVMIALAVTAGVVFPEATIFGPLLSIVAIAAVAWFLYQVANKRTAR